MHTNPAPSPLKQTGHWSPRQFFALELLDNRFPALHGLRVLAIISVIQFHITWFFAGEQGIAINRGFMDRSQTVFFGMDLFFILSGFLIGSILLRSLADSGTQQLRRFYLRRIFRTFPSYYVVLTVLALATPLTAAQHAHLPHEYLYATNFMPLGRGDVIMFWGWSLALEEQFYLTVPLLFAILYRCRSDRARIALLVGLWASALVIRLAIFYRGAPWSDLFLYGALYFRTYTRFDTLVAGIILAFVFRCYRAPLARWFAKPFHRALVALPSMGCLWVLLNPWVFGIENMQLLHVFAWGTITSVMWLGFLLLLLHSDGWISTLLSRPFWRRIATLGYGVYLVHVPLCDHLIIPAAHALESRHVSMALVWPASLVILFGLSLGAAYLLHILVEKPSLRVREWLAG